MIFLSDLRTSKFIIIKWLRLRLRVLPIHFTGSLVVTTLYLNLGLGSAQTDIPDTGKCSVEYNILVKFHSDELQPQTRLNPKIQKK